MSNFNLINLNLFIVEDNEVTLLLYDNILRSFGINILDIAKNGLEAIEKYQQLEAKPDVIIMDYQMPIMNVIECSKKIIEIDPDAKIIFVSSESKIKKAAISIGAKDFLEKPFKIKDLLQKINKVVKI